MAFRGLPQPAVLVAGALPLTWGAWAQGGESSAQNSHEGAGAEIAPRTSDLRPVQKPETASAGEGTKAPKGHLGHPPAPLLLKGETWTGFLEEGA